LQRRGRARWLKSNREEAAPLVPLTRCRALPPRLRVRLGPSRRIERSGQRQNRRHPESVNSLQPKAMINRSEPPSHPGSWSALGTTKRPSLSSWTNYLRCLPRHSCLPRRARTRRGCQRRLKTDPLSILIAEVNLTHPSTVCCSGSVRDHFRLASGSLLVRFWFAFGSPIGRMLFASQSIRVAKSQ
jgi:hypothetical protein